MISLTAPKKNLPALIILYAAGILCLCAACSSAPKRPPAIYASRNNAIAQIDLANRSSSRGEFVSAHLFLDEAWRLAVSTDDPDTRIRVRLSRGNAWYGAGEIIKAEDEWKEALAEAEESGNAELSGASRVFLARASLAEGRSDVAAEERAERARNARSVAKAELKTLKDNILFTALAWRVIGLCEKELSHPDEAEKAIHQSLALHDKHSYLEDAAWDWFLIASVRSKAGELPLAHTALDESIAFNRRAENSSGLGEAWMAKGLVFEKEGKGDRATVAYTRARDIFRSALLDAQAEEAERKIAHNQ